MTTSRNVGVKQFFEDLSCDAILNTDKFYGPDPELFGTSGDQCSVANVPFLWSGLYSCSSINEIPHSLSWLFHVIIFARISSYISIFFIWINYVPKWFRYARRGLYFLDCVCLFDVWFLGWGGDWFLITLSFNGFPIVFPFLVNHFLVNFLKFVFFLQFFFFIIYTYNITCARHICYRFYYCFDQIKCAGLFHWVFFYSMFHFFSELRFIFLHFN